MARGQQRATSCGVFLSKAAEVSPRHPVVVSKFFENAKEIEVDAVAVKGEIVAMAVIEHVENAGVHSGDATLVLPPQRTYLETMRKVSRISGRIAASLHITGPFNVQFLARGHRREGHRVQPARLAQLPLRLQDLQGELHRPGDPRDPWGSPVQRPEKSLLDLDYVGVKAPQFSFTRLQGADPTSGVEMASTGEVGCLGDDFEEAFLKALISVGFRFPIRSRPALDRPARRQGGLPRGRAAASWPRDHASTRRAEPPSSSRGYGLPATVVSLAVGGGRAAARWSSSRGRPSTWSSTSPRTSRRPSSPTTTTSAAGRSTSAIPLLTNIQLANRLAEALARKGISDLKIKELQAY